MFHSVGSFRFEPRLSAENRHKVGLHGESVAKISALANDPMGSAFAMEMNRSPTPARGRMPAMTTAELRSNVLRLPAEDRAAIARDLIASLDAGDADPNAESLWATEIERRARDVADSRVALVDADEVHAEAARRLRTRAGG